MDVLYEIWGSVMRNKMRTLATGIAVASGLFLMIVLQGAGNGIIHTFNRNQSGFSFDAIHVWGGWTSLPFDGMERGRRILLNHRDEGMVNLRFPTETKGVTSIISQSGLTASYGTEYLAGVELEGIHPRYAEMSALKVIQGRMIHELDVAERRKVLLMSEKREKELAPRGKSLLNEYLLIDGKYFRVVGIYEDDQMSSQTTLYTPYTTVQTLYGRGTAIDELMISGKELDTEEKNESFETRLRQGLGKIHTFHPEDQSAVWIWNQARDNEQMNRASSILQVSLWVLGMLTLLSGVVGVSNIMLIAVKERTREFGIRKALGATPWNIIRMIIFESIIITGIFGYIGMFAGVAFCSYMDASVGNRTLDFGVDKMQYFVDPTVDITTCLWATLVMIISGAVAGFFPAHKASKVKPIEALRA